jgi:lipoate-protein ligase A
MGLDEGLLQSARNGSATLRLYTWEGPWLSLGYGQGEDPLCLARCRLGGVGLVRRVTGGAAVLHGSDLTYALAAPSSALPEGLAAAYHLVSSALLEALRGVRVDAWRSVGPGLARSPGRRPFDCFLRPEAHEICAGPFPGRKLVGSAQRRVAGALLQHGSIRLTPDPPSAVAAAGLSHAAATSLSELGSSVGKEEIGSCLARALAGLLELPLETDEASPIERESALARMRSHSADPLAPPAALREVLSRGLSAGR